VFSEKSASNLAGNFSPSQIPATASKPSNSSSDSSSISEFEGLWEDVGLEVSGIHRLAQNIGGPPQMRFEGID
jgi:hypothetical protein